MISQGVIGWDVRVARAAALGTFVAFALVVFVTAVSDEGGVPWNERIVRSLGALPLAVAIGAWLALEARRRRGELSALAALGRSPARAGLAATAGAMLMAALVLAFGLARRGTDVSAFFPDAHASATGTFRYDGEAFVELETGVRVLPDGTFGPSVSPEPEAARASSAANAPVVAKSGAGRATVAFVVALGAIAFALFASRSLTRLRLADAGVTLVTIGATVWSFHAIAAQGAPLIFAILPMFALFSHAVLRYRQAR